MKILFIASEVDPLIKVGGLSDVVRSLPIALSHLSIDCRIVIPAYPSLDVSTNQFRQITSFVMHVPAGPVKVVIYQTDLPGSNIPVYVLSLSQGLTQAEIYPPLDGPDAMRFHLFCRATIEWLGRFDWQPNILHCHDAMAAPIPYLVKHHHVATPTVLTIHNIVPQSPTPLPILLNAGVDLTTNLQQETLNVLRLGIAFADKITTVSPTYAREVLQKPHGYGLEDALIQRREDFSGIINGLDTQEYSPSIDQALSKTYAAPTASIGKQSNKRSVQAHLGLEPSPEVPLFAFIGRISSQKGIELIQELMADKSFLSQAQLVILGTGSQRYEPGLRRLARLSPERISLQLRFDTVLAHQIYAAADFLLMPSQFEPCGLTQMIAMRYGTIPVVRRTGGLADTVIDIADQKQGTGIMFSDFTIQAFSQAIDRAIALYDNKPDLHQHITHDMEADFSWDKSAKDYLNLYQSLLTDS